MHIGVDSANAVDAPYFDSVAARLGAKPEFWGRYLADYALSSAEVTVLSSYQCRILPIYNGATASTCTGSHDDGAAAAGVAVNKLAALQAPQALAVYLDIEYGWMLSGPYLAGWIDAMAGAGFVPGLYCAPSSAAIPLAYFGLSSTQQAALKVFSAQPSVDGGTNSSAHCVVQALPSSFTPSPIRSENGDERAADLWQRVIKCYHQQYDIDLCEATAFDLMWMQHGLLTHVQ